MIRDDINVFSGKQYPISFVGPTPGDEYTIGNLYEYLRSREEARGDRRPARERYRCTECHTRRRLTKRQRARRRASLPFCSRRCRHAHESRRALDDDDDDGDALPFGNFNGPLYLGAASQAFAALHKATTVSTEALVAAMQRANKSIAGNTSGS